MQNRTSLPVEQIKDRLSIVDVISSYLTLEPSGINYKAKCPFHNEKTPSFFVSPERNSYYCFGCGAKGDIFSFVQNFEGVDFRGALKTLADRAGVPLVYDSNEKREDKDKLYEVMESATEYFEKQFANTPEARAYLLGRGLTDITIALFRIGYAPNSWRSLSDALIKNGYSEKELEDVGLIKRSEKGVYDRFRGRIIFPISDSSGRVIAFSGRTFSLPGEKESEHEEAKYLNSPDTALFNKSNVLFGIDKAKLSIRTRGYAVIVEGQMDLLLSHQMGCTNTVAVSGTALSSSTTDTSNSINNLGLIRRLSSNVIFAFDGDQAGVRAAGRSALIALTLDMQAKIAVLPEGKDPADIIAENPNEWKKILANATHIISFYIDHITAKSTDARIRGRQIREIVFPYISAVKSAMDQSAYMHEITVKTGIPESALQNDFETYTKSQPVKTVDTTIEEKPSDSKSTSSRRANIEKQLFGIIFMEESRGWPNTDVKSAIENCKNNIGHEVYTELLRTYEVMKDTLALEAEIWYGVETNRIIKDVEELSLNLEEEILQEKLQTLTPLLASKDSGPGGGDEQNLLKNYQEIVTRIHTIKSRRRE